MSPILSTRVIRIAQSTSLFYSLLNTLRSIVCSNEAINLSANDDIPVGDFFFKHLVEQTEQ